MFYSDKTAPKVDFLDCISTKQFLKYFVHKDARTNVRMNRQSKNITRSPAPF